MLPIASPFPQFFDLDGSPLEAGFVYVGVANQNPETSPVQLYWDTLLASPAAQPLRTIAGYIARSGAPGLPFCGSDYSIRVRNSVGIEVFYAASSQEFSMLAQAQDLVDEANVIRDDLEDTSSASKNAGMSGFNPALNYLAGTIGWWDRHAGVSLLRYMPITTWAAIVAGTNSVDLTTYVQAALNDVRDNGVELNGHGYKYKCNSGLTLKRTASGHNKNHSIHSFTIDNTGMTAAGSGIGLDVGASDISFMQEGKRTFIGEVSFLGPESQNSAVSGGIISPTPDGTTTGLRLNYAANVKLDGLYGQRYYKGIKASNTWLLNAVSCCMSANYIDYHVGSAVTISNWLACEANSGRYGFLAMPDAVGDNIGSLKLDTFRFENCLQPFSADPLESGSNTTIFRSIHMLNCRFEQNAYDLVRIGKAWTFANPQTPGADRTDYTRGIFFYGGEWDAPVGPGTNYRIRGSTNGFITGGDIDIPCGERTQINGTFVAVTIHVQPDPNGGAASGNTYFPDGSVIHLGGDQILTTRRTGWGAPTGTATRTTFNTATVTLPQLAEHVKALIDDLTTHGLTGT